MTTQELPDNRRTQLVGTRTGLLAELIVAIVRIAGIASELLKAGLARMTSVVTTFGWVVLALVPVCLVSGYRLGWTELIVIGWALVVVALVAVLAVFGRGRFVMKLDLQHHRVVVGESAESLLLIANPTSRRLLGTTVEIPVGEHIVEVAVPGLRADGRAARKFPVPSEHRGLIPVGPVRTVRSDPFGLVRREIIWTPVEELIVHPRTVPVPSTSTGLIRDLEGTATRDLTASDVSFHALREYQRGDERRYIHWKSTAKTGTHMVRQFEQTRRSHLVIGLSLSERDYLDDFEFELAVSVAGSLGVRAILDGRTVSVLASERTPEFARKRIIAVRPLTTVRPSALLDDLAVVERSQSAVGLRDLARVIAETVNGVSIAFMICGSVPSASQLRAAAAVFGPDVEVVVVTCSPEAVPGMRRIPGLNVLRVGLLEDLRTALARSAAMAS